MFKQTLYLIALVLILAIVGSFGVAVFKTLKKMPVLAPNASSSAPSAVPSAAILSPAVQKGEVAASPPEAINDITVTTPVANAVIQNPLIVSGAAVGNWYFEASFPVIITDGEGLILGETSARAIGNWMTTSTVPFSATLTFSPPRTANGFLILKNDNPSGNPATQRSIEIPIRFR